MEPTERKAEALLAEGKVRKGATGGRAIYFSVEGSTETHQVSFAPARAKWNCDCKYSSVHPGRECSHIIACRKLLASGNVPSRGEPE
ncbi:MAG: hypothetical protein V1820_03290 [archaeon]